MGAWCLYGGFERVWMLHGVDVGCCVVRVGECGLVCVVDGVWCML